MVGGGVTVNAGGYRPRARAGIPSQAPNRHLGITSLGVGPTATIVADSHPGYLHWVCGLCGRCRGEVPAADVSRVLPEHPAWQCVIGPIVADDAVFKETRGIETRFQIWHGLNCTVRDDDSQAAVPTRGLGLGLTLAMRLGERQFRFGVQDRGDHRRKDGYSDDQRCRDPGALPGAARSKIRVCVSRWSEHAASPGPAAILG